jgi:hypothetical protein
MYEKPTVERIIKSTHLESVLPPFRQQHLIQRHVSPPTFKASRNCSQTRQFAAGALPAASMVDVKAIIICDEQTQRHRAPQQVPHQPNIAAKEHNRTQNRSLVKPSNGIDERVHYSEHRLSN